MQAKTVFIATQIYQLNFLQTMNFHILNLTLIFIFPISQASHVLPPPVRMLPSFPWQFQVKHNLLKQDFPPSLKTDFPAPTDCWIPPPLLTKQCYPFKMSSLQLYGLWGIKDLNSTTLNMLKISLCYYVSQSYLTLNFPSFAMFDFTLFHHTKWLLNHRH